MRRSISPRWESAGAYGTKWRITLSLALIRGEQRPSCVRPMRERRRRRTLRGMQRDAATSRPAIGAVFQRLHWNQDYVDVLMGLALMGLALSTAVRDHYRLDAISVSLLILQTLPIALRRRSPMADPDPHGVGDYPVQPARLPGRKRYGGLQRSIWRCRGLLQPWPRNEPRRRATVAAGNDCSLRPDQLRRLRSIRFAYRLDREPERYLLSFGLAWLIGDNLRVRRAYTRQLEDRAAELEHEREEKSGPGRDRGARRIAVSCTTW